ncbi:beta-galactosidase [Streptomyces poriticola]|uniref:beta-galactosidase n=1 Tax=Streptomyces poriticola TaxID=3120506 RepID=UPI002FCE6164
MELTRRTFSALAGTTVLGLSLGGGSIGAAIPSDAGNGTDGTQVPTGPPPAPPTADGHRHQVGFDRHSLLVDGRRLVLWPGELHPFRLPSPSLWRDVLQRMRAHGYNAVSVPVAWNHHSFGPGRHDFTGVRDLDLFLRTAAEERLYVVLRPGPWLGADLDTGGLPAWLAATGCRARSTDPAYLRHADAWLADVDAVAARHLYTHGGGTVLLYQLEETPDRAYRDHLRRRVRADGIDVPLVTGYAERRPSGGAADERLRRLGRFAEGAALPNVSLAYGGSSWGWLAAAGATASHGAGAALDGGRQPTDELAVTHQLGHLLRHVPDFARLEPAARARASDERLAVTHLANPDTGLQVYVLRNDSGAAVTASLSGTPVEPPVTVPAGDARLLVAGMSLGGERKLAYSTAQPMALLSAGRWDIAVFTGRRGETAHVALDCPSRPKPTRLDPEAAWAYERGRLHVTAPLGKGGLTRVRVRDGGSDRTLLLLFADDATSLRLWPCTTPSGGAFLVYGPTLLRSASVHGDTVRLTGDTTDDLGVEVWGPHGTTGVEWNGSPLRPDRGLGGSITAERPPGGAPPMVLPALTGWRRRTGDPESAPEFDDSDWTVADWRTSTGATPVPDHQPVLFADDYGCHTGDVWYRGRLAHPAGLEALSLTWGAAADGLLMAWLDGEPLGTHRMPDADDPAAGRRTRTATARFALPERLRRRLRERPAAGPATVLSVLVRPMGHSAQVDARGTHRAARGLIGAFFEGATPQVRWRLQGAAGTDPVRGPLNTGGLYGEREGWHLPGYDDGGWQPVTLPRAEPRQGVTWYRTEFRLGVDPDVDASVGLEFGDGGPAVRRHRVQIFLNGWNLGQYVGGGPPHTFALPSGILRTGAAVNTLALAVLSDGDSPSGPGEVRLTLLGVAAGGLPVAPVDSPGR